MAAKLINIEVGGEASALCPHFLPRRAAEGVRPHHHLITVDDEGADPRHPHGRRRRRSPIRIAAIREPDRAAAADRDDDEEVGEVAAAGSSRSRPSSSIADRAAEFGEAGTEGEG